MKFKKSTYYTKYKFYNTVEKKSQVDFFLFTAQAANQMNFYMKKKWIFTSGPDKYKITFWQLQHYKKDSSIDKKPAPFFVSFQKHSKVKTNMLRHSNYKVLWKYHAICYKMLKQIIGRLDWLICMNNNLQQTWKRLKQTLLNFLFRSRDYMNGTTLYNILS